MKTTWLIENYTTDIKYLVSALEKQNIEYYICGNNIHHIYDYPNIIKSDCVIFYGTLSLGRRLQKEKYWIPRVYCNFDNLCCSSYYSHYGKYLLNSDYIMLPLLEIKRQQDFVFDRFGIDNAIFVRPNSGAKPITGQIIKKENIDKILDEFKEKAGNDLEKIIVIISSPKNINTEWRFVVVNKKVITGCQYIKNSKINIKKNFHPEAFKLSQEIANEDWQPDIVYTLDVCRTHHSSYHLLEVNSFSCCGLYKCNMDEIVKEVSQAAIEEYKDYVEI